MWNTTTVSVALAHHWASQGLAGFSLNRDDNSWSSVTVCVSHRTVHLPFNPVVSVSSWHPWSTLFHLPFSAPCSWMGRITCQGFGSSINRLWKRAELASTHSPCVTVADATTPTGKKQGVGGGCNGNCPSFSRLQESPHFFSVVSGTCWLP